MDLGGATDIIVDTSEAWSFAERDGYSLSGAFERLRTDALLTKAAFEAKVVVCEICYLANEGEEMRVCANCGAHACESCFKGWLITRIFSGHSSACSIRCISCTHEVSHEEIREICGERMYQKLLYFLSRSEHRNDPAAVWCAHDGCWRLLREGIPGTMKKHWSKSDKQDTITCGHCVCFLDGLLFPGSICGHPQTVSKNDRRLLFSVSDKSVSLLFSPSADVRYLRRLP